MLPEHPIHATIPATDLERARAFYADKLAAIGSPRGSQAWRRRARRVGRGGADRAGRL